MYPIFCEFGFPLILQSDNGGEFANGLLTALLDYVNANHRFTTPYNPRANGGVERYVGISTTLVGKLLEGAINLWDLKLPTAQLTINSRLTGHHNSSSFSLMLGRPAPSFRLLDADLLPASTASCPDLLSSEALPDTSEWREVLDQLESLVYPSIRELRDMTNLQRQKRFNKNNKNSSPLRWVLLSWPKIL